MQADLTWGELNAVGADVRRTVLGNRHVATFGVDKDSATEALFELATTVCWGAVWSRKALSLQQRSLLNIGILIALGHGRELKIHLRGALRNGLSAEMLGEAVIHSAMYCGFPAAIEGMTHLREVLGERDAEVPRTADGAHDNVPEMP